MTFRLSIEKTGIFSITESVNVTCACSNVISLRHASLLPNSATVVLNVINLVILNKVSYFYGPKPAFQMGTKRQPEAKLGLQFLTDRDEISFHRQS